MIKNIDANHPPIAKVIITTFIFRYLGFSSMLGDTGFHEVWWKHVSD